MRLGCGWRLTQQAGRAFAGITEGVREWVGEVDLLAVYFLITGSWGTFDYLNVACFLAVVWPGNSPLIS